MSFLADTNIILRLTQPQHPMYVAAFTSLATLRRRGEIGYVTSQNLIEFWRTCTRPVEKNGLGMTIIEAESELNWVETRFPLLPDLPDIYPQWRRLVTTYEVKGVNVHDARLVAAMLVHGLTQLTRVPLSIKKAKDILVNVGESKFQTSEQKGYKYQEIQVTYHGIKQRWLIVESEARKKSDYCQNYYQIG